MSKATHLRLRLRPPALSRALELCRQIDRLFRRPVEYIRTRIAGRLDGRRLRSSRDLRNAFVRISRRVTSRAYS
jgi:hypothetical protein